MCLDKTKWGLKVDWGKLTTENQKSFSSISQKDLFDCVSLSAAFSCFSTSLLSLRMFRGRQGGRKGESSAAWLILQEAVFSGLVFSRRWTWQCNFLSNPVSKRSIRSFEYQPAGVQSVNLVHTRNLWTTWEYKFRKFLERNSSLYWCWNAELYFISTYHVIWRAKKHEISF